MAKRKVSRRKYSQKTAISPAEQITAAIIEKLEAGTKPWVQPWRGIPVSRPLRSCGTPYKGMNVIWLWMVAETSGFGSPYWMTYRQCAKLGGQVRKGEKSTIAIFYKSYTKDIDGSDNEETKETRRVSKAYAVFNADQCEGLPEFYHPLPEDVTVQPEGRVAELDQFFESVGAKIVHCGSHAFYQSGLDRITMPKPELFNSFDHYYATLAHELSHWTGHSSRLDRDLKNRFGSAAYAAEELVAELSSAMLGGELGLPVSHLDSHASYIGHWLKLLKSDDRAILTAAAKAEEASSLLIHLGGKSRMPQSDRAPLTTKAA
ncbi:zincin-like metallopeptidase domain-containing protein [Parasphingorhabdus sp. JC815]|uniref:ArdC family protein n=1 Tax=Parasphingorhabdus sp. JC815 TaxID=3232140 RepID=UPI00345B1F01